MSILGVMQAMLSISDGGHDQPRCTCTKFELRHMVSQCEPRLFFL